MAIVKTSWEEFLSTDSEIPHDVHFLAITENEGNHSRKLIRAHKVLLAGVSPVFRGMLFGPLKETREVIEDTFENAQWGKVKQSNQCDFASFQAGDLRRHMKMHSGEKSNKCNQCDFASSRAGHLKRHMITHTG